MNVIFCKDRIPNILRRAFSNWLTRNQIHYAIAPRSVEANIQIAVDAWRYSCTISYTFRNIQSAAASLDDLRGQKLILPRLVNAIQERQEPITCTQPPLDRVRRVSGAVLGKEAEDCLFLDLTVPEKVFRGEKETVPVLISVHRRYYSLFLLGLFHCKLMRVSQGSKDKGWGRDRLKVGMSAKYGNMSLHQFVKLSNGGIISVGANCRVSLVSE